jgi:hypothetical protein
MPSILSEIGLQFLGIYSATVIYRYQLLMPIFITLLLLSFFLIKNAINNKKYACNIQDKSNYQKILSFFVHNLIIGYIILGILYIIIPPHNTTLFDTQALGFINYDKGVVALRYNDSRRFWPWTTRYFTAKITDSNEQLTVQETYWYNRILKQDFSLFSSGTPVYVRLYGRPINGVIDRGKQFFSIQFYLTYHMEEISD